VAGTLESISGTTGQVILRGPPQPLRVLGYLAGEVVEVIPNEGVAIEADVTLIQGIFGVGGEAFGPIRTACAEPGQALTPELIRPEMNGAVIVGGGRVTGAALSEAVRAGAAAVVTGGIDDADLKGFLGYDLGVAITGSEQVGLTLILTEGFGEIAMAERTWRLLRSREGDEAAVNGTTQIRAGVMRPEIVIPLDMRQAEGGDGKGDKSNLPRSDPEGASHKLDLSPFPSPPSPAGQLGLDSPVRIIRDPYFGLIGRVAALPPEPQALDSGSRARVLEVELTSGRRVTVPRANVELIEE